jgi:hypothetical protein
MVLLCEACHFAAVLQALVAVLAVVAAAAVLKNMYALPKMPVYLVDFSVHKGLEEWKFRKDMFVPLSRETGVSPPHLAPTLCWARSCRAHASHIGSQMRDCAASRTAAQRMWCSCSTSCASCSACAKADSGALGTGVVVSVVLQRFDETELDFQEKILYRSGLGDETYIPPCEYPLACRAALAASSVPAPAAVQPAQAHHAVGYSAHSSQVHASTDVSAALDS